MIRFDNLDNYYEALSLWNHEVGFIYPIPQKIYTNRIINYQQKIAYGAYDKNQLVGFIIGKISDIPNFTNLGWISLIYVSKKYRRQGIASHLLSLLEEQFKGKDEIIVGKDLDNIFPGIPTDFDNLTDLFFEKRGYISGKYTHDLINRNPFSLQLKHDASQFIVCTKEYQEQLLAFVKRNFDGRWYLETQDYFAQGGNGSSYVLGLDEDRVIAFARISDRSEDFLPYHLTWYMRFQKLGGIGPLGVDKEYRGSGFGYDIVGYAINILKSRNVQEIMIDWTGLLEFYQQFGFEVWKSFKYMSKKA